jgi:multidrug efflux pump
MISATVLAIFFVPVFFVFVLRLFRARRPGDQQEDGDAEAPATETPARSQEPAGGAAVTPARSSA